jgi:hypothetical protein
MPFPDIPNQLWLLLDGPLSLCDMPQTLCGMPEIPGPGRTRSRPWSSLIGNSGCLSRRRAAAGGLPRVPLPREFPQASDSVLAVLAGTAHPAATGLDLTGLSRLLHLSAGVVRTRTFENGFVHPFRASGSAGARLAALDVPYVQLLLLSIKLLTLMLVT